LLKALAFAERLQALSPGRVLNGLAKIDEVVHPGNLFLFQGQGTRLLETVQPSYIHDVDGPLAMHRETAHLDALPGCPWLVILVGEDRGPHLDGIAKPPRKLPRGELIGEPCLVELLNTKLKIAQVGHSRSRCS